VDQSSGTGRRPAGTPPSSPVESTPVGADRVVPLTELFESDEPLPGEHAAADPSPAAGSPAGRRRGWTWSVAAAGVLGLVLVLAAAAALDGDPDAAGRPPASPPAKAVPAATPTVLPTVLHEERASRVFGVASSSSSGPVLRTDPTELVVGKAIDPYPRSELQEVVVVLPLAGVRTRCVQAATLQLRVAGVQGTGQVGVYPSAATSLAEGRLPPGGQADAARLLDNRPRGVAVIKSAGVVEIDVSALYRLWAAGTPFPSQGRYVSAGTPLVLVVRPTDLTSGRWRVALRQPPHMQYRLRAGCS